MKSLLSKITLTLMILCCISPVFAAEATWVTEEVLRQLQEIKTELSSLRQDVVSLNSAIASIKTSGATIAAGSLGAGRVSFAGRPVLGDSDAPIAIIEFTDYQCPYCSRHSRSVFPDIKTQFIDTGKIQYVLSDFPLPSHPQARGAAVAANCAGEQDSYWAMHDELFANASLLGESFYLGSARSFGLDMDAFAKCLNDPSKYLRWKPVCVMALKGNCNDSASRCSV